MVILAQEGCDISGMLLLLAAHQTPFLGGHITIIRRLFSLRFGAKVFHRVRAMLAGDGQYVLSDAHITVQSMFDEWDVTRRTPTAF